jgi:hypothetical protein
MPAKQTQSNYSAIKRVCLLFAAIGLIGAFSFNWDDVHGALIWAAFSTLLFFISFLALVICMIAERAKNKK